MDNQHKMIPGYRDLGEVEIRVIQEIKELERTVAKYYNDLPDRSEVNVSGPEYTTAMNKLTEGFMYLVKSVAKPDSPWKRRNIRS